MECTCDIPLKEDFITCNMKREKKRPWKDLPKGFLLVRKDSIISKEKYQFFEGMTAKQANKMLEK